MPKAYNAGLVDIACVLKHETAAAYLVDDGINEALWLPKSQVELWEDARQGTMVTLPEWLALEKGMI